MKQPAPFRNAGKTRGRPQSVGTPQWLIELEERSIGGGRFDLDPATNQRDQARIRARVALTKADNGLRLPWRDACRERGVVLRTVHCNPPWEDLDVWLPRLACEAATGLVVRAVLPLRPHRRYWVWADAVCFLDPVAFVGQAWGFPLPVIVAAWGEVELFQGVFGEAFPGATFRVSSSNQGGLALHAEKAEYCVTMVGKKKTGKNSSVASRRAAGLDSWGQHERDLLERSHAAQGRLFVALLEMIAMAEPPYVTESRRGWSEPLMRALKDMWRGPGGVTMVDAADIEKHLLSVLPTRSLELTRIVRLAVGNILQLHRIRDFEIEHTEVVPAQAAASTARAPVARAKAKKATKKPSRRDAEDGRALQARGKRRRTKDESAKAPKAKAGGAKAPKAKAGGAKTRPVLDLGGVDGALRALLVAARRDAPNQAGPDVEMSVDQLRKALGVSRPTVLRALRRLLEIGEVKRVGKGPATRWVWAKTVDTQTERSPEPTPELPLVDAMTNGGRSPIDLEKVVLADA